LSNQTGRDVSKGSVKKFRQGLGLLKNHWKPDEQPETTEPYKLTQTGRNTAIIESCPEGALKTLDGLLREGNVDLDVWRVDRWVLNKWPVGAKAERKSLRWANGRIEEGFVESDGLTVAQLWQVKAWLVRIKPEPLYPIVQPIACDYEYSVPALPLPKQSVRRSVIVTDPHFGFVRLPLQLKVIPLHDRTVLDLALQIFAYCHADRLDVLGDILDLSDMSDKFLQMPEYSDFLQPAVNDAHRWFRRARDINKSARITAHEGNHDIRMITAMVKHLKGAYDLRAADELELPPMYSVPRLLALHKLGVLWIGGYPDDKDWLNDAVCLSHGDVARKPPGATARAIVESSDVSKVCGHAHRNEFASRTIHRRDDSRTISAHVVGCACHTDGRLPGSDSEEQWQNAIAVIDYDDLWYNVTTIPIEDGVAIYDGKLFKAQ